MKINQTHRDEWVVNSEVHPEIVKLNVQTINKVEEYTTESLLFDLLHPNPKRTNSGRLDASGLRQFDNCLETSGWWVSGIDPFTWDDMEWGRFKPDPDTPLAQPYFNNKTGQWEKAGKYRSPARVISRLVLLKVPDSIWYRVSVRYNIPISEAEKQHPGGFWHWVLQHPQIPIILTEGEKKAGCLLTLGYVAIPLPGIWMARRSADNVTKINEHLIPDLAIFAQAKRPITIIFDNDPKLQTKVNVYKATIATAKLLDQAGCKVQVGMLPSATDGKNAIDDFVVAGRDIGQIINNAVDWEIYKDNCQPIPPWEFQVKTKWDSFIESTAKQIKPFTPTTPTTISFCHAPNLELAERLSETLIGCDNKGNFLYNETQLLQLLTHHDKTIPLNLYPTPGYINKTHLHKYFKLQQFLAEKGYELQIGWWEQWYKNALTVEQCPKQDIKYITWSEFKHKNRYSKRCYKKAQKFTPDIEVNERYLDGKYIAKNIIKQRSLTGINAAMGTGKSVSIGEALKIHCAEKSQLPEFNEKLAKLITAYKEIEEKLNTPEQLSLLSEPKDLKALKTKKQNLWEQIEKLNQQIETEAIRVKQAIANVGAFLWSHRNSLLLQNGRELGFTHLRFDEAYTSAKDPKSWLTFCVDSIARLEYEDLENRIIFIDEISSVIPHLLAGATCRKFRKHILDKITHALKYAYAVVILDANLKDWEFDYIAELGEFKTCTKIQNTYQKAPLDITFFNGTVDDKGVLNPNNYEPLLQQIRHDYANGEILVIATDAQNFSEYIHEYLGGDQNPEIIRIDGQTITGEKQRALMEDPNGEITTNGYRVVIYSPSMDTGISITLENYFTKGYSFNFHLGAESYSQLPGRIRDTKVKWYHWSKEFLTNPDQGFNSNSPTEIGEQIVSFVYSDVFNALPNDQKQLIKEAHKIITNSRDIHFKNYCQIQAQQNYEKQNLRETYYEKLVEDGHNIRQIVAPKMPKCVEWKDVKISVKRRNSELTFYAEDLDIPEAEQIFQEFNASPEKQRAAHKTMLTQVRLPGLMNTPVWCPELLWFLKYEDRQCLNRLELRHLFNNPELEICRKAKWFHNLNIGVEEGFQADKIMLQDFRSPQLKAKMLRDIGIDQLLAKRFDEAGNPTLFTNSSPELIKIAQLANHWRRQPYFGRRGGTPLIKYINKLLARIGFKLTQVKQNETRIYQIEDIYLQVQKPKLFDRTLDLTESLMPIIAQKFERKLETAEEQVAKASQSSPQPPNTYTKQELLGVTQPYAQPTSEATYPSGAVNLDLYSLPPDTPLGDLSLYQDNMPELAGDLEILIDLPPVQQPDLTPLEAFKYKVQTFGWNVIKEAAKHSVALALKVQRLVKQLVEGGEWGFAPG